MIRGSLLGRADQAATSNEFDLSFAWLAILFRIGSIQLEMAGNDMSIAITGFSQASVATTQALELAKHQDLPEGAPDFVGVNIRRAESSRDRSQSWKAREAAARMGNNEFQRETAKVITEWQHVLGIRAREQR